MNRTKVITIGNHKGGVGKTTSSINIGAGLAKLNKKVLLIDLDPQANLTLSLGISSFQKSIYNLLKEKPININPVKITKNLDLIPSCLDLSAAEIELSSETGREYILKDTIQEIIKHYNYIIIDCPPSLGLLTLNALTTSDLVIIPVQAHYLAMQGLSKFVEIINKIQNRLNKNLKIGGVVITQYDNRKILNRNVLTSITDFFENKVFKTNIRNNIALAEAPTNAVDIFRYQPKSNGAEDYIALCHEVLCIQ